MRKNIAVIILFALLSLTMQARVFVHPGSLLSMDEINTIKAHVSGQDELFYSEWQNFWMMI